MPQVAIKIPPEFIGYQVVLQVQGILKMQAGKPDRIEDGKVYLQETIGGTKFEYQYELDKIMFVRCYGVRCGS